MDELSAKLSVLEIRSFEGEDGTLTVISSSEPYFCFVGNSQRELGDVVKKALESYARNFFSKDITVSIGYDDVEPIRTVQLKQRGRLRPSFDSRHLEGCYA